MQIDYKLTSVTQYNSISTRGSIQGPTALAMHPLVTFLFLLLLFYSDNLALIPILQNVLYG